MSVLDASVVLKWFVNEADSVQALQLREEFYRGTREIIVPDLLLFEVANALRYNSGFTAEEIREAIRTLFDIGIEIITPTYSLVAKAIGLAKSLDVTCYDAAYLALAEELGVEFVTADERFCKRVRAMDPQLLVSLLADLSQGA
ncbi:MAG: type II toxin-antitoxin system VapC family toxin [Anaerolineae bacterium]